MKLNTLHTRVIEEGWKERAQAMFLGGAIGAGLGYGIGDKLNRPEVPGTPQKQRKQTEEPKKTPQRGINRAIHISDLMGFIEPFEGRRKRAYDDSLGNRTIGIGLNLDDRGAVKKQIQDLGYDFEDVYNGKTALSDKHINKLFRQNVMIALKDATQAVDNFYNLPREVQFVVVDMVYNLGLPKFLGFKKTIQALNDGDFIEAAKEMKKSRWYHQVGRRSKHHVNVVRKHGKSITESIQRLILEGADLVDVLSKHFPNLDKVLQKHNINSSNLEMIGRGDKGTAFTDGNVVVKVTEDKREAMASANLIGSDIPNVNNIHAVYKFSKDIPYQEEGDEEPIETPYYLIIQDMLDTNLDRNEAAAAEAVGNFLIDMNRRLPWPFNPSALVNHVKNHHYMKKREMLGGPSVDNAIESLLGAVSNLYAKKHVKLLDVSSDNVGKDASGNLTLFDFGVSESPKLAFKAI